MNWDIVKGNAKQLSGIVKQKWGKLTDDDVALLSGKSDEFFGRVQERMGIGRERAEQELDEMLRSVQGKQARPS
jgi:uncharacterized protein YjbJ (UPF0337 family)